MWLWRSRDELTFSNIRPKYIVYTLLFPVALILSDIQYLDLDYAMWGMESYVLIVYAYALGWLVCIFLPAKSILPLLRASAFVTAGALAYMLILPAMPGKMIAMLVYHVAIGVSVGCSFYIFAFMLENAERFFGVLLIMLYYGLAVYILWEYEAIAHFLKTTGSALLAVGFLVLVLLARRAKVPVQEARKPRKGARGAYAVFIVYLLYFVVDTMGIYIDYELEFTIGFYVGVGILVSLLVAFILQVVFNRSAWHMWNLFLVLTVIGLALMLLDIGTRVGSVLYGIATGVGYIGVMYMLGGVGKRSGNMVFFRVACTVTFLNNSLLPFLLDHLYYSYEGNVELLSFGIVIGCIILALLLMPLLFSQLFATDWADDYHKIDMATFSEQLATIDKMDLLDSLNLTDREKEIFALLLTEAAPKQIAGSLKISYPTVNFHTKNLYRKLGIQSRTELFALYSDYTG